MISTRGFMHPRRPSRVILEFAVQHHHKQAAMLVLPPVSATLVAQVLAAALTVALTGALVSIGSSIRYKTRAAKLLEPVPGPKGLFLLGFVPELTKNMKRMYDFQVLYCTQFIYYFVILNTRMDRTLLTYLL